MFSARHSVRLHDRLTRIFPEPLVLLFYAVIVGLFGGYGAVLFRKLITFLTPLFFTGIRNVFHDAGLGHADVLLLPVIGLVVVSILVKYLAPEAKGHGVPEVMAAIAVNKSRIRGRIVLVKAVASAITIASGGSVGREGPIVQIGSALGSKLGQSLGLSESRLRLMVACGAGAGIAATFNAPIGGVMFATEVILENFSLQNFTAIVISAVVSAAVGRAYLGNHPSFPMPSFVVGHFSIYWVYVIVGLIAGVWSFAYIKVLYGVEDWFGARNWPFWAKAAFGGALVGLIGIFFPQVFGVGYHSVDLALTARISIELAVLLLVLKLLVTAITIGAGGSGGVFSPGLYMGSMLGVSVGGLLMHLNPHLGISPGALAVFGMAGVFAGSAQAPVTAIMMLFEMTGDYNIILPLMITAVLSATVASTLSKDTIYTWKLVRRGLDIRRKRHPDKMQSVTISEALPQDRFMLTTMMTVRDAWASFSNSPAWFALVKNEVGEVIGSVARAKVLEALNSQLAGEPISQLLPTQMVSIDVNQTLADALTEMDRHNVTYLLVTSGGIGVDVIGSSDIIRVYRAVE